MLFISPHPSYQLTGIRPAQDVYHPASGAYMRTIPGIDAEFFIGGAPRWAVEQALANEKFQAAWSGLPDDAERRAYVGSYDTDAQAEQHGWDDETKEYVEQFLLNNVNYGTRYIAAEPPAATKAPPWPNYDNTHHFQVVKVMKDIGADPAYVLEYEREHKNRDSVMSAVEAELGTPPAESEPDELVAA